MGFRPLLAMLFAVAIGCGDDVTYLPIGDAAPSDASLDARADASDDASRLDGSDAGDAVAPDAPLPPDGGGIFGVITTPEGAAIAGARVTLVSSTGAYLDERRSDGSGGYVFDDLDAAAYVVGASFLRREYRESSATVADAAVRVDITLGAETQGGRWTVVGNTGDEFFAGTPSATVTPDGRVMYCHSTEDALLFDPRSGELEDAMMSPSSQGCHMQTVLTDGRVIFVGGQDPEDPASFVNAVDYVKTYDVAANDWDELPDLNEQRWYPTLVRFADERLIACGGGQRPDARRTAACEIFNPATEMWTPTGSLMQPTEYSPSALLLNGEILTTWSPPQLYNATTGMWRATGNLQQTDRGYPDHSDHSLVLLENGDALAVGIKGVAGEAMIERYDPDLGTWSLGASPAAIRSRPEVLMLPDGRVFCAGGRYEGTGSDVELNPWGQVRLTDLYDPELDSWRSVSPMILAREYHALTVLAPDGRVLTTSGTGNQASGPSSENTIEAFEPPYLFRGPRPTITGLSSSDLRRGEMVTLAFGNTSAPTAVVLLGTNAVTHWMDGGVPRLVRPPFAVAGGELQVSLPTDPNALPSGYYNLFVMVDDIPSEGRIVRVLR